MYVRCTLIGLLLVSSLLLGTVESGVESGLSQTSLSEVGDIPPFPKGTDIKGPLVFRDGEIVSGSIDTAYHGSLYKVRSRQYRGKVGECEEEITIAWLTKSTGKFFYTKCEYKVERTTKLNDDLLLIGSPNDEFCAFTTNKNEIYYLDNGNWKKGDFSGDNSNDQELTSSEVSSLKERLNKWEAFFVNHYKEIQKLESLRNTVTVYHNRKNEEFKGLRNQEREKNKGIFENVIQLKNEERTKYVKEYENIIEIRRKEGYSDRSEKMKDEEDRRHNEAEAKLVQMINDEDARHDNENNKNNELIKQYDSYYEDEISQLDALMNEEYSRKSKEFTEMIIQGL